jgi:hypothetical protein
MYKKKSMHFVFTSLFSIIGTYKYYNESETGMPQNRSQNSELFKLFVQVDIFKLLHNYPINNLRCLNKQ